jgi:hypothetical protein
MTEKFPLGRVIITPTAAAWLSADCIARALGRHASGDWGDVCPETAWTNNEAIGRAGKLISLYWKHGPDFRIVTAGDRSTTKVSMCWEWSGQGAAFDVPPEHVPSA